MTENLLQKLEDRAMAILAELEKLRGEVKQLKHENFSLRTEKENSSRKLQDLVALLEGIPVSGSTTMSTQEQVFLQGSAANAA